MAKAKRVYTVATIYLELTEKEAGVLRSVLRQVSSALSGLRGLADAVDGALDKVGVVPIGVPTGSIRFPD